MCPGGHRRRARNSAEKTRHHLEGGQQKSGPGGAGLPPRAAQVPGICFCVRTGTLLTSHLLVFQEGVHVVWWQEMFASQCVCVCVRVGGHCWTGWGKEHSISFTGLVSLFRDLSENTTSGWQERLAGTTEKVDILRITARQEDSVLCVPRLPQGRVKSGQMCESRRDFHLSFAAGQRGPHERFTYSNEWMKGLENTDYPQSD